jgi:hypothetical protein
MGMVINWQDLKRSPHLTLADVFDDVFEEGAGFAVQVFRGWS